jgi:hypothetical protein
MTNERGSFGIIPEFGINLGQLSQYDGYFQGEKGQRLKNLVIWAANEVGINPGLLASSLVSEIDPSNYLRRDSVASLVIGTDHYWSKRNDIESKVPAAKNVGWNRLMGPQIVEVDKKGTKAELIYFRSGKDALLAHAVYLKHGEIRLRETAKKAGGNFDSLPAETRFVLTRIAFNAGHGRAFRNLNEALKGKDILIRRVSRWGPQRAATVHSAQAIHLSETVFRVPAHPRRSPLRGAIRQRVRSTNTRDNLERKRQEHWQKQRQLAEKMRRQLEQQRRLQQQWQRQQQQQRQLQQIRRFR